MAGRTRTKKLERISYADPDPNPGIGGYDYPRGPYGATGFPGSTSDVRENPEAAEGKLHDDYTARHPRRSWKTIRAQQANVIPESEVTKGPENARNPDRVRDTERRPRIVTSKGTPGGERQRNTVYRGGRQAVPGAEHTYKSAPKGGFEITEVTRPSRYTFGGVNGGTDLLDDSLQDRRMPYTGMGGTPQTVWPVKGIRSVRGAYLDGDRFYQAPGSSLRMGSQGGAYGQRVRGHERHRPTIFKEPAPWTGRFYDTTTNVGGPDTPGSNTHVREAVHVSPRARSRRNRGF